MKCDVLSVQFPPVVSVTDQDIDISSFTNIDRSYYLNFLQKIFDVYASKNIPRVVIGLVGVTGAGKSLTAALLDSLAAQIEKPFAFHTLGIDAYHFPNAHLEKASLKGRKGAPDTYNVESLIADITRFRRGETVSFPRYSRVRHEPAPAAQVISDEHALLLVEGLWLLHDAQGWEMVRPLLDFSVFMEAGEQKTVRDRVVARHVRGGRSQREAAAYYESVDTHNSDSVLCTKAKADYVLASYSNISHGTLTA